jgi:hypothetical protein
MRRYCLYNGLQIESITLLTLRLFVTTLSRSQKRRNLTIFQYMSQIYFQLFLLCHRR